MYKVSYQLTWISFHRGMTYAAPNISIPITASFRFKGSCTLMTIGTGKKRMTTSAITSVYNKERNIGTV